MKRREFITSSLLTIAGTTLFTACDNKVKKREKGASHDKVVTKKFKNYDISLLGFGCMRLPTINEQIDMPQFEKMVDYAMRRGINYFDTAYMYHGGESENAVGKVLSNYKRDSFFLATKNPTRLLTSKSDVRRILEEQLKKCQTDYFDFYLAHNISVTTVDNYRNFDVYNEMVKFKQEGKIRHIGFSYHGADDLLEEVANENPWEFCQIQINYLDWTAMDIRKNYEVLEKAQIPTIAMTPLRGGKLTELTGSAKAVLKDEAPNDTPASFGLRWVAGRENIFTLLSGMSNIQQLEENIETFTNYTPFTQHEEKVANKISDILQQQGEINCTRCNYCYDCPRGVAIPKIFSLYNDYKATSDANAFISKYDALKDREKAHRCIKCGLCNSQCPQLLDIPNLLDKVIESINDLKAQVTEV